MASSVLVCSRLWISALLGVLMATTLTPALSREPVESFARLPKIGSVAISPTGKYIAIKQEVQGKYELLIESIIGDRLQTTYMGRSGDFEVRWMEWVTPTRLLVSLGFAARRYRVPTFETRLIAINYDGSDSIDMIRQSSNEIALQVQDKVIDILRHDPDHVLMAYNAENASRPIVHKVNIYTGRGKVVQSSRSGIFSWSTDQRGEVRIGIGIKNERWQTLIRGAYDREWRTLRSEAALAQTTFDILGFTKDPNTLYVLSNHAGGRNALYEYNLESDSFGKKIFGRPEGDVIGITWHARQDRIESVLYQSNGVRRHWIDPSAEKLMEGLSQALPGLAISRASSSWTGDTLVIFAYSVTNPGGYYIVKKNTGQIFSIGSDYPELDGVRLSPIHAFSYQASDGLKIPAYLTLPPAITDIQDASDLPMVVMPHGGPTARDYATFNEYVQFLANRGYAVFQMNFRGSSGFGNSFEAAGYGQWGQRMQDDITDGVRHLIDKGIADPNRICIFGISYGGYASFMGAIRTPDLYQCAASLNGVSDLRRFIRANSKYVEGRSGLITANVGDYSDDRNMLREFSPKLRANEITIPILIAAAGDDRVVLAEQSSSMASALRSAGKDYTFLELESGGHSLTTSESRLTFMKALEGFLARHLN